MVNDVSGNINDQNDLFLLCQKYGWSPLFLCSKEVDFKWDSLFHELEACRAAGELKLCEDLVDTVRRIKGKPPFKYSSQIKRYTSSKISPQKINYSWFQFLPGWRYLFVKYRTPRVLRLILSEQDLEPQVFCFQQKDDFARQWGLEMKYWNARQKHDLVVALGNSASWLNLVHPDIERYLHESNLAVGRKNKLIVLKAIKRSPLRSRIDYEKSILMAWSLDPDYDVYLDLLRKVVAFRLRQKKRYGLLLEDFSREIVEFEVTKKLANYLMHA